MNGLLNYLLQMGAVSAILYGYYHFFLRNKKFHYYNRYYLLAAALLSILIPFINIPIYFTQETANSNLLNTLTILSFGGEETVAVVTAKKPVFTFTQVIYGVYMLICIVLLIRIVASITRINKLYRDNPVEKLDQIFLVQTNEPGTPFSYFRWLFWNREIELDSESGQQIFRHELYHIRQKHSLDVFFMEFLTTIIWFNPFFYLIKKELRAIHEFLADQAAVNKNEEWNYAELLLMQVLQTNQTLVNPFFHNQIKRRIAMITSSQKPKHQYIRKMMVLPLVAILTLLFAFTYKEIKERKIALTEPIKPTLVDTVPGKVKTVEIWTQGLPLDGKKKASAYVQYHNDGRTFFQADSIVFKTANCELNRTLPKSLIVLNGEVMPEGFSLKGQRVIAKEVVVYGENDANAIKKYGDRAKQGVIEFKEGSILKDVELEEVRIKGYPNGNPLIVLDGITQSDVGKQVLGSINPNDIKSVTVLKDMSAIEKYGTPGANGVIEIITKDNVKPIELTIVDTVDARTPIFTQVETPPAFIGGQPGWQKFLERNLNSIVPIEKGAPVGSYTTKVRFIVNANGKVSDIKPMTNHGYGMEEEVIRVIKEGPVWIPARQNGRTVRAYKEQPVTFVVTDDFEGEVKEVKVVKGKPLSEKVIRDVVVEEEIKGDAQLGEVVVVGYPKAKSTGQLQSPIETKTLQLFKDGNIFPNPVKDFLIIPLSSSVPGKAVIKITNVKGELVSSQNFELLKGLNNIKVNCSSLAKGGYVVNVSLPDKGARSYKMIKE